jgi:hypothetical protein
MTLVTLQALNQSALVAVVDSMTNLLASQTAAETCRHGITLMGAALTMHAEARVVAIL